MTAFEEFGLIPELGKAVEEMDWLLPTDVQAEAIPLILGGKFFKNITKIALNVLQTNKKKKKVVMC